MLNGRVLVVAGSDCSGGAGLEADQKVLAAHGCYAMTATTALTAQNTTGVQDIHVIPSDFVKRQIEACIEDIGVDVVKTGMLASASTIAMVAQQISRYKITSLVVDPVMVSTSGAQLLPTEAIGELLRHLLPLTTVLTPNIPEAKLISSEIGGPAGHQINSLSDVEDIGRRIKALGPEWVLVKGGHLPFRSDMTVAQSEDEKKFIVDVLVGPGNQTLRVQSPYQASSSTHGTGCSLASAISAGLAKGVDVPTAVQSACRYIEVAIRTAPNYGSGNGPLHHFHSLQILPFSPGYFLEYLLQRPDIKSAWKKFVHHPFVMAMGDGSLPLDSFKGYIIQDYHYLVHFSRANALAAAKSKDLSEISRSTQVVAHIVRELQLHIKYCEAFGISPQGILATSENQACTAYTRYCLDIGQSQDWFALQMAMAPCLLGYGSVAKMLLEHDATIRGETNIYWPWIQNYTADDYTAAVKVGSELLEEYAQLQSPSRIEELVGIFRRATEMEIGFWEMFPYK